MTIPYLSKEALIKIRKEALKKNPNGVPKEILGGLDKSFASLMQEVRKEGAIRTPYGRGFRAGDVLKKELDI